MINSGANEEQIIYSHLQKCAEVESPSELIERFRLLFIESNEYPNLQVWQALRKIVASPVAERDFKFIINRSCYILINKWKWQNQPRFRDAIVKLISLFDSEPSKPASSRINQRLRQLIQRFRQTEQYRSLRYLAQVISTKHEQEENAQSKQLITLIGRYPCLYEHCLLTNDSSEEQRQQIKLMRTRQQQQFQIALSRYCTYQQLSKKSQSVSNPTLLSNCQLEVALKQFTGKVDGHNTYRDLAEQFRTYSRWTRSYRTFKKELYGYLTSSIEPKYRTGEFSQRLSQHLQSTLPQNDSQQLSNALMEGTCRKLLNFLVVESPKQPNHYIFSDLTSNLGVTATVSLLLKIVLLCRPVKQDLEKRFAILFNHYQALTRETVGWLVESLENLNVALSTNFGALKIGNC